jgi:hypothetical protein
MCGVAALGTTLMAGTSSAAGASPPFARAYAITTAAKTASISLNFTVKSQQTETTATASGVITWKGGNGQLSEHIQANGKTVTVAERVVNSQVYVQVPPADLNQTGGKHWLQFDLSSLTSGSTAQDPNQGLVLLEAESDNVTKVGTANIGGVPTTQYRASVNLTKVPAGTSPEVRRLIAAAATSIGTTTLPMTVAIDSSGRVRRIGYTATLTKPATSTTTGAEANAFPITLTFEETITGVGVPVHVSAPAPSDVKQEGDLSSLTH